jgi:hypothetical protein
MSVEIVLIPLAIAAVMAARSRQTQRSKTSTGHHITTVSTRMNDSEVLLAALDDMGVDASWRDGVATFRWQDHSVRLDRNDDGLWRLVFGGLIADDRALACATALDEAYCRVLQRVVLQQIRERAFLAGTVLRDEVVNEDQSVTLTLEVRGQP